MFGLVNFANFIGDLISILMGFLVSVVSWISQTVSRFWLALVAIIGGALVWMADFILQLILGWVCFCMDTAVALVETVPLDLSWTQSAINIAPDAAYVMQYYLPMTEIGTIIVAYWATASAVWLVRLLIKIFPFIG